MNPAVQRHRAARLTDLGETTRTTKPDVTAANTRSLLAPCHIFIVNISEHVKEFSDPPPEATPRHGQQGKYFKFPPLQYSQLQQVAVFSKVT